MRCVAVVPEFFGTEDYILKTYIENGLDVYPVVKRIGFSNPFLLIKSGLGFNMDNDLERYWVNLSNYIEDYCNKVKPDLIIVTQGMQLLPDAVKRLKKSCVTVLRMSDRISLFPQLEERLKYYDFVYSYSKEEVDYINSIGYEACFYPGGFDSDTYYPIDDMSKDIDICFVGTMYSERVNILEKLARDFEDYTVAFYGKYVKPTSIGKYVSWIKGSKGLRAFKNKNLSRDAVNKLYNRSKICLNINRANMINEWTPRILEIMGSKSFQIVEGNDSIDSSFRDCLCQYYGYDDLVNKIHYYLTHEEERNTIAINGYLLSKEKYTSRYRSKVFLERLKADTRSILNSEKRVFV